MAVFAQAKSEFNLPSQPLAESLKALGSLTSVNVLVEPELVDGRQAPALNAQLTVVEALTRLLAGTGIEYRFLNENTIVLAAAPERASTNNSAGMRAVHVARNERASKAGANESTQYAAAAAGDSSSSATSSAQDAPGKVEEIIVTAQKREERLIDTPQSVSVVSAADIARMGALQFRDLAKAIPGLTFTTLGAGASQINLRGVSTGTDVSATVVSYIDDVPFGSTNAYNSGASANLDLALFDLDRVEVLKGPQGTIYGAAAVGGLIKYVTKRPDSHRFGGDLQTGVSSTQDGGIGFNVAGAVNLPIVSDRLALRVSGFEARDGGFIDNIPLDQKDVDRSDVYGGRLDLLYTPNDAFSVRLNGFFQNISRDGEATADYTNAGVATAGSLTQRRFYPGSFEQHYRLASGTVSYDFGPMTLTSISSYQTAPTVSLFDRSALDVPTLGRPPFNVALSANGSVQRTNVYRFMQEVRLASNGHQKVEWLLGAAYDRQTADKKQAFDPRDLAGNPYPNTFYTLDLPSLYEDYAAFADLTYRFTEKFDITGGIRYARNDQTVTQIGSGSFTGSRPERSDENTVATYLANARYHFSDRATGYLRYATGYRPGGPNIVLNNPATGQPLADPTFDADSLRSYEAGIKAETAGRRLGLDITGYYIDWSDIQIIAIRNGIGIRTNAPSGATVRGVEAALTARPVDSLTLAGALAYTKAELSGPAPDLGGVKGERLPFAPDFTANASADYELALGSFRPTIGAMVQYVGDRTTTFGRAVPPQYYLPSYTTVDLRAGFALRSVNLQLYLHNAFDERGQISGGGNFAGLSRIAIQQPRTVGLSATTSF